MATPPLAYKKTASPNASSLDTDQIPKVSRREGCIWTTQTIERRYEVESLYCKPLSADEFTVAFREEHAIKIWASESQRDIQIFKEACQLIEILLEIADAPVTIIEIVFSLEHTQKVLLSSATTVTRQYFSTWANCSNPEDWAEEERYKFFARFTSIVPGRWRDRDIINSWKKLLKKLTRKMRLRKPGKTPTNESDLSLCATVIGTEI